MNLFIRISTVITIAFIMSGKPILAQGSDLGGFIGTSYYIGELNPGMPFLEPQLAGGLVYRYNFNNRIALRAGGLYGKLTGSATKDYLTAQKGLSFNTHIAEASAICEINFLPFRFGKPNESYYSTTYLFGGIAGFNFNTKNEANDEIIEKKHPFINISFPFGMGLKFNVSNKISMAAEWGLRKTLTDYIDDVSTRSAITGYQRGNSENNDWYSFAGLIITIRLPERQDNCSFMYE